MINNLKERLPKSIKRSLYSDDPQRLFEKNARTNFFLINEGPKWRRGGRPPRSDRKKERN